MSKAALKTLIDRILLDDLTPEEHLFLLESLKTDRELSKYYDQTLELKEQLASKSDDQFYPVEDLHTARELLFKNIHPKKYFSLGQLLIAACLTFIVTSAVFLRVFSTTQTPNAHDDILSYQFSENRNGELVINGRKATPYKLVANENSQSVQRILTQAAKTDPNVGNRIVALDYLDRLSPNNDHALRQLASELLSNESNVPLRLQALAALEKAPVDDKLTSLYLDILNREQNKLIQIIEQLAKMATDKQREFVIKQLSPDSLQN